MTRDSRSEMLKKALQFLVHPPRSYSVYTIRKRPYGIPYDKENPTVWVGEAQRRRDTLFFIWSMIIRGNRMDHTMYL